MKDLYQSQFLIEKDWLYEIKEELVPSSIDSKIHQADIATILFDALCHNFAYELEKNATDTALSSERWGRDGRGQYRILRKLYVINGEIFCTQEEHMNLSLESENGRSLVQTAPVSRIEPSWFLAKLWLPTVESHIAFFQQANDFFAEEENSRLLVEKARANVLKYSIFLPKPILSYFGV